MIIGQKEIYEYLKKHPKAQNPLMYERHFGGEKIL